MLNAKIDSADTPTPTSPIEARAAIVSFDGDNHNNTNEYDYVQPSPTVAAIAEARPVAIINKVNATTPPPQPPQLQKKHYVYVGSRKPVMLTYCPSCAEQNVATRTVTKTTGSTWACVGVGFLLFWPLCWVPLVAKSMKQTNHYCQCCGAKVGRVKPFQ